MWVLCPPPFPPCPTLPPPPKKNQPQNGRWVIFNDEKVAASEHPPLSMGYMYIYRRVEDSSSGGGDGQQQQQQS